MTDELSIKITAERVEGDFNFFTDNNGRWWWTKYKTTSQDEVIGRSHSQAYENKADAEANAERFGHNGQWRHTQDDTWKIYEDKAGEYRWNRTAKNGQIVGASHKGWMSETHAWVNAVENGYGA